MAHKKHEHDRQGQKMKLCCGESAAEASPFTKPLASWH